MKTLLTCLAYLAAVGTFAVATPAFANHPLAAPSLGTSLHDARAEHVDRTIVLDAGTKWVNVTGGEKIKFVADGKSFSWLFDNYGNSMAFGLERIAPAGILSGRPIKVYVAQELQYNN